MDPLKKLTAENKCRCVGQQGNSIYFFEKLGKINGNLQIFIVIFRRRVDS